MSHHHPATVAVRAGPPPDIEDAPVVAPPHRSAGIDHRMLRLAVGCEDVRDLIADLDHAL